MIDTILMILATVVALGGGYGIVWLIMHLLAEPGTEVKVIGVGSYTKRPKRQKRVRKRRAGSVETKPQMAILSAYAILDETSVGNQRLYNLITKGTSLSQIDCSTALDELVDRGFVTSGIVGSDHGWHYHLTSAGKQWIQENNQIIDKFRPSSS